MGDIQTLLISAIIAASPIAGYGISRYTKQEIDSGIRYIRIARAISAGAILGLISYFLMDPPKAIAAAIIGSIAAYGAHRLDRPLAHFGIISVLNFVAKDLSISELAMGIAIIYGLLAGSECGKDDSLKTTSWMCGTYLAITIAAMIWQRSMSF